MAVGEPEVAVAKRTPYQLDHAQTTQACKVLLKHISDERKRRDAQADKPNLLKSSSDSGDDTSDAAQTPIWLILTTKKHIVDAKRLKPSKISIPHSINTSPTSSICLITADPQSTYSTLCTSDAFPSHLQTRIQKVISFTNIKKQYGTFEARRQLLATYDIFLADDRIVTYLPTALGKVFYKGTTKRPIPVSIAEQPGRDADGKRSKLDPASGKLQKQRNKDKESTGRGAGKPEAVAREIERALSSAIVTLAPGSTTSVKAAHSGMTAEEVKENVEAVTEGLIEKFVTSKWRNVRAVHIKAPESMSFPIWATDELWAEDEDVLEEKKALGQTRREANDEKKKLKARDAESKQLPAADGEESISKKRKADEVKRPSAAKHVKKKRKIELEAQMAAETQLRKERLKKQKADTLAAIA